MEMKRVKVHMYGQDGKEIKGRNFGKVFDVYEKNGKYGIDWHTEGSFDYVWSNGAFAPFETFASSVVFEDVDSGKSYYMDNITNKMVEAKEN